MKRYVADEGFLFDWKEPRFTGEGEEGMYPSNKKELQLLINSYNEAVKVFGQDKVRIAVYSNYLYDDCNEDDFTLEEFLDNFKLIKD